MTIEIELNERALARLKKMAEEKDVSIKKALQDIIEHVLEAQVPDDPILGMFAQEPELMDDAVADAMKARGRDPFRQCNG
ncbi:MAG: hypothetical protein ACLFV5_07275 [Anaerolineales bacterium]